MKGDLPEEKKLVCNLLNAILEIIELNSVMTIGYFDDHCQNN